MSQARHIFLVGMMGAGKSTIGRAVAQTLSRTFVDLDAHIENIAGQSISQIFDTHGESKFREMERTAFLDLVEQQEPLVLALGGGTYTHADVRELAATRGTTFFLRAAWPTLANRLREDRAHRPLLSQDGWEQEAQRLMSAREPIYRQGTIELDANGPAPKVTEALLAQLASGAAETVEVPLGGRSYTITIDNGGVESLVQMLRRLRQDKVYGRLHLLTDQNVADLYLEGIKPVGFDSVYVCEPGEGAKSVESIASVWRHLLDAKVSRNDAIVAFGGGVVGDLAGFAAATILRGISFVQVPTTILAQIDSSVGGKTGINAATGKNLIGAFHQPDAVVIATSLLRSLPAREVQSGFGEMVKYGLLGTESELARLESEAARIAQAPCTMAPFIAWSCRLKAAVVADDERERGRRALLNLGHTFGHAIEAIEGFGGVSHGQAVGYGILMAIASAPVLGLNNNEQAQQLYRRIFHLMQSLGLDVSKTKYYLQHPDLEGWMLRDKKSTQSMLNLVIPVSVGDVRIHPIEHRELNLLLAEVARQEIFA